MRIKAKSNVFLAALLSVCAALAFASTSFAVPYYGSGSLTTTDPTFANPGGSSIGTAIQHYDILQFSITVTGAYTFEMSSLNTAGAGNISNALDTFMRIYANTFNPLAPAGSIASHDDFTGTLTVMPGPFTAAGLTTAGTGSGGLQPSSRILNLNLIAGTQYFLVLTSFRSTDYLPSTTLAGPRGNYWYGINGPGDVNVVPEPSTTALLVLAAGGLAVVVRRKRKAA